jgi:hypothetical protein
MGSHGDNVLESAGPPPAATESPVMLPSRNSIETMLARPFDVRWGSFASLFGDAPLRPFCPSLLAYRRNRFPIN